MSTTTPGRNWLEMTPGHFDASLLPRTRKGPEGQPGLFSVADVATSRTPASTPQAELDGQAELFACE